MGLKNKHITGRRHPVSPMIFRPLPTRHAPSSSQGRSDGGPANLWRSCSWEFRLISMECNGNSWGVSGVASLHGRYRQVNPSWVCLKWDPRQWLLHREYQEQWMEEMGFIPKSVFRGNHVGIHHHGSSQESYNPSCSWMNHDEPNSYHQEFSGNRSYLLSGMNHQVHPHGLLKRMKRYIQCL